MKKMNQKLTVFMVPNGQGGFRQESYSSRKNMGSSSTVSAYARSGFFIHGDAWQYERKLTKNSRRNRDLIFPPTTVLDDIDAYFINFPD